MSNVWVRTDRSSVDALSLAYYPAQHWVIKYPWDPREESFWGERLPPWFDDFVISTPLDPNE